MARKKLNLANNPLLSSSRSFSKRNAVKSVESEASIQTKTSYKEIALNSIERDQNQPRVNFDQEKLKELADSITQYGVLTPILVSPSSIPNRYRLVAGERRLRASTMAGLSTIPAVIDADYGIEGEKTLAVQLIENIQRADLTPLERAHAIGALKDTYSLSIRQIAERLSASKGMVQRSLEILDLPDDLLNALREGVAESKVLMLAKVSDPEKRATLLRESDSITRDELKARISPSKKSKTKSLSPSVLSAEDKRLSEEIQRALGMKVQMSRPQQNSEQGKVTIQFYSDEDLQEVFRRLVSAA